MLKVKSLGVAKEVPKDSDMAYAKPTIDNNGKKFKEVSNGFVMYNKYVAIFSGYLKMRAGTVTAEESILTLPFKPKYPNAYITCRVGSNNATAYIDVDGNLKKQTQQTFAEDDYMFVVGVVAISHGGG